MTFQERLLEVQASIGTCLDSILEQFGARSLHAGMRHALAGGKRIRGLLVMEGARLHGIDDTRSVRCAAAVECLHAYSLAHDDLPCMDNDDTRRGMPTIHVKWDEATAILVGDGLQALAFEILSDPATSPCGTVRSRLVNELARAVGSNGMVLGQGMDLAAMKSREPLSQEQLRECQSLKTGALISWSARAGPILARADPTRLGKYAEAVGLAYQIADDLLDNKADDPSNGDAWSTDDNPKEATFLTLYGEDGARKLARQLVDEACSALVDFGARADVLLGLARFAIERAH